MSSILVNTALFHLKDEERKIALSMLLLLGLRHYAEKTGTQTIDLPKLQNLHGMWFYALIIVIFRDRRICTNIYYYFFCVLSLGGAILELGKTNLQPKANVAKKASVRVKASGSATEDKRVKPPVYMRSKGVSSRSPRPDVTHLFPLQIKRQILTSCCGHDLTARPFSSLELLHGGELRKSHLKTMHKAMQLYPIQKYVLLCSCLAWLFPRSFEKCLKKKL